MGRRMERRQGKRDALRKMGSSKTDGLKFRQELIKMLSLQRSRGRPLDEIERELRVVHKLSTGNVDKLLKIIEIRKVGFKDRIRNFMKKSHGE